MNFLKRFFGWVQSFGAKRKILVLASFHDVQEIWPHTRRLSDVVPNWNVLEVWNPIVKPVMGNERIWNMQIEFPTGLTLHNLEHALNQVTLRPDKSLGIWLPNADQNTVHEILKSFAIRHAFTEIYIGQRQVRKSDGKYILVFTKILI